MTCVDRVTGVSIGLLKYLVEKTKGKYLTTAFAEALQSTYKMLNSSKD